MELTKPGLTCFNDLSLSKQGSVALGFEHSTFAWKDNVLTDSVRDTALTEIIDEFPTDGLLTGITLPELHPLKVDYVYIVVSVTQVEK